MIRASVGALLFNTLIWKDKNVVDQSHPFAADEMKVIYDKYEKLDDESDEKKHIFKTVLYSLNKIISFGVPTTWLWLPVLLKETPQAEHCEDEELDKMTCCLVALAQSYQKRDVIAHGMEVMTKCAKRDSWQIRLTILRLLQRVLFRNFFLNQIHSDTIEKMVVTMLDDSRIEVRECAGRTLSGLYRCRVICPSGKERDQFAKNFRNAKNEVEQHAAVLGLEALIGSAPYDIPEWLPKTIEPLCQAASISKNCSAKISAQRALREFKRTHYDQWEEHREKFNEEQRYMLTDILVSPSYYA